MKLYEQVAQNLVGRIEQAYYGEGEKLPSIRDLSQSHEVSISTAQEAYRLLEDQGWAVSRPKSGYYVLAQNKPSAQLPSVARPAQKPLEISQWDAVLKLINGNSNSELIQLGRGAPDIHAPTLKPLIRLHSELFRHNPLEHFAYSSLKGNDKLCMQIARITMDSGCHLHPDDIISTTGCQEALSISLKATTEPGDVVVVDSPSFYGSMQAFKAHGLKALEIPTHPETGISLEALELALEQWPVKIIQLTPTCNNPLGYTMPVENKKRLLELAGRYDIAIIEDDIYGDISYQAPRPPTIKSFDSDGRVLLCSSFSKTVAPGIRVGWVAPGRYLNKVLHLKYVSTASTSSLAQAALAEFIAQGGYERHLRKMRQQYKKNRDVMISWIEKYFPANTRMSYPQGGFVLWIEFDGKIDCIALNDKCMEHNISIAPGVLFSASEKYNHCMRINFTDRPNEKNENAVQLIGTIAKTMLSDL